MHLARCANRPGTALLVIDMQRDVVKQSHDVDNVTANINSPVATARSESLHGALARGYDTGQQCAHHRRHAGVGLTDLARAGHRVGQPVLELLRRSGPDMADRCDA